MSIIRFAFRHVNDSNQDLLQAIVDEFKLYIETNDECLLVSEDVLDEVYYNLELDDRIISINNDAFSEFETLTHTLVTQQIPYEIHHYCNHDSNASIELHRPGINNIDGLYETDIHYKDIRFLTSSDYSNEPLLSLTEIRKLIDSSNENQTDKEILDRLSAYMNAIDFGRVGNRIIDFA